MKDKPAILFHTLGCKLNQAESEDLALKFSQAGYSVTRGDTADICILNTCTVTHIADRKSRHMLRLMRKNNPQALIIAAGCYAQRATGELRRLGVNIIVSNQQKGQLLQIVEQAVSPVAKRSLSMDSSSVMERVRSFVKIQDGCGDFCTYCIVPTVRGTGYCLSADEVIKTISSRVASGYKEVVLTGTKIGAYNHDGVDLTRLVQRIINDTKLPRLHVSSLQPQEISADLLVLWSNARLCRHFHIALQSGNDVVLKRMGRRYSTLDYEKAVAAVREMVPDAAITTDIMVGFPGETEEEFEASYQFCRATEFADIHVFSYSARPGTVAATLPHHVNDKAKKERSLRMLALAKDRTISYAEQFLNTTEMVLWENEQKQDSGLYSGLTANYIRVFTRSNKALVGQLLPAKLTKLYKDGVWGELMK